MELKSNATLIDANLAPTNSKITFYLSHSEAGFKHWRTPSVGIDNWVLPRRNRKGTESGLVLPHGTVIVSVQVVTPWVQLNHGRLNVEGNVASGISKLKQKSTQPTKFKK